MKSKQSTLLRKLAKQLKSRENENPAVVRQSLESAKIVTSSGEFTNKYPNIRRVISLAK
tara:strand:- start:405 stop:581 length:177 start_codon:yes stop_codon:yes gene_type:complete